MRFSRLYVVGISIAIILVCGSVTAQNAPSQKLSDNGLTVYAGAIFFDNPALDTVVLVEFPFSLNRSDFQFFRPDTTDPRYYARVFAQLNLYGVDGQPVDSATTYFSVAANNLIDAAKPGIKLFNNLALFIKPGVYSADLTVIDVKSKSKGKFSYKRIIVEPPVKDHLSIGGKCLAYQISRIDSSKSAPTDRLELNGYHVLPNPLGVFDVTDTSLCLYAEMYNMKYSAGDTSRYELGYRLLDESGQQVRNYGYRIRQKPGSTLVITEDLSIANLPVGTYRLQILASDLETLQADTDHVTFRIFSPSTLADMARQAPRPDPYDTLSLAVKLELVHYLLNPIQKRTLGLLSDSGKARFLDQYWKDNDPDPSTPENESRDEMIQRLLYCNAMFSTSVMDKEDGWSTDRGRIYMTYGRWDQRDDIEAPKTGRPFEVWHYDHIKEGAVFVFEDQQGYHDYTLVHSNVEGEVYSSKWNAILDQELYKIN